MKYILVSGGVVSGLGKGVTASSVGVLLKSCGWRVTAIKIDPYINMDAGTMSPFEHGEVFVLDDGGEADLDLGNYERFLDVTLTADNNITTGKVYHQVIERERQGKFLGKTVQVVPHVTDAIQEWIERVARIPNDGSSEEPDVCVIELGGTVGDIESMPFIEALRQLFYRVGEDNFMSVHVSLVPVLGPVGEQKTKPTQHSVKELRSLGINPDIVICRSSTPLASEVRRKLGMFCQVAPEGVISCSDVSNIYHVPLVMQEQGVTNQIIQRLKLVWRLPVRLAKWKLLAERADECAMKPIVRIAMVGKYTTLTDTYLSVVKALQHAALEVGRKLQIDWVEASALEQNSDSTNTDASCQAQKQLESDREGAWAALRACDGILVPGGFGLRGLEGKILACEYARKEKKPFFGICLGFQAAAIEAARNILGVDGATTEEVVLAVDEAASESSADKSKFACVFMPEGSRSHLGGTMRLGSRKTIIRDASCVAARLYGGLAVHERHRHRYEVNPDMVARLEKEAGMTFVGHDETKSRMEIFELKDHPFYFGVQYHPEFKSRPGRPSPPFLGLLLAATGELKSFTNHGDAMSRMPSPWESPLLNAAEGTVPAFKPLP